MNKAKSAGTFTVAARRRWEALPPSDRKLFADTSWCASCGSQRAMRVKGGSVVKGDLILFGTCSKCGEELKRLVEGD